jgi:hypothetical protein
VSLLECSGCHIRTYCSTPCQKAAWAEHKAICKAFQDTGSIRSAKSHDECTRAIEEGGLPFGMAKLLSTLVNRVSVSLAKRPTKKRVETLADLVAELTIHEHGSLFGQMFYEKKESVLGALAKVAEKKRFPEVAITLMVMKRVFKEMSAIADSSSG